MLVRHEPRCDKVQRVSRGWTLKRGGGLSRAKAVNEVDAARDRATPEEEEEDSEGGMFIKGKTSERDGRCARTCDTDVLSHVSKTQNAFDSEALDGT